MPNLVFPIKIFPLKGPHSIQRRSRRSKQGILGEVLEGEPPNHLEGAIAVGVGRAIVDEHGGDEREDMEDNEDGDEPSVGSTPPRVRAEKGELLLRRFVEGELGLRRRLDFDVRFELRRIIEGEKRLRRLDFDVRLELRLGVFHGGCTEGEFRE